MRRLVLPAYAGMIPARLCSAMEKIVLPAYAGMIPVRVDPQKVYEGAPRIRGDDPPCKSLIRQSLECSPHTRG